MIRPHPSTTSFNLPLLSKLDAAQHEDKHWQTPYFSLYFKKQYDPWYSRSCLFLLLKLGLK